MTNTSCFQRYSDCFTSYDLIMIKNLQGGYYFAKYNNGCAESPIFKLKKRLNEFGQEQLQLIVMEVLYPVPLYDTNTTNKNILRAIHDGMAVARETDTIITFTLNPNYKTEISNIKEVTYVNRLDVLEYVSVICDTSGKATGTFQVNAATTSNTKYEFYLASNASYGKVDLNSKTGSWTYTSLTNPIQRDSFTLLVWDGFGSWATEQVLIKITGDSTSSVQDVNLVNVTSPVPVIPTGVVPVEGCVQVVNSPKVSIDQPVSVTGSVNIANSINIANTPIPVVQSAVVPVEGCVQIANSPTVRIDQPIAVTGAVNLDPNATVAINGTPTVLIEEPVSVTGTVNLDPQAAVAISGTPTVLIEEPVSVTGTVNLDPQAAVAISGTPTVLIEEPVSVTGTVNLDPQAAVAISGTPTVLIAQPVQVTLVDLPVAITTGVVTVTGVEVGLALTSIQLAATNLSGATTFVTPAVDMSQFTEFVYLVHSEASGTAATGYTIQPQIAAVNDPNYFLDSGNNAIVGLSAVNNVAVDTKYMAQFTRLAITGGDAGSSAYVEVYLQAQYLI